DVQGDSIQGDDGAVALLVDLAQVSDCDQKGDVLSNQKVKGVPDIESLSNDCSAIVAVSRLSSQRLSTAPGLAAVSLGERRLYRIIRWRGWRKKGLGVTDA
ncbi:MAG: hypothetical protein WCC45_11925, partial [Paeniglutamicibacter sp.]